LERINDEELEQFAFQYEIDDNVNVFFLHHYKS